MSVSQSSLRPHSPLTLITAPGSGHRDDPHITVEKTGSERATVTYRATQRARPGNTEAWCGEQDVTPKYLKPLTNIAKPVLIFVLQKAVLRPTPPLSA